MSYKFFSNLDCEYYPCHGLIDQNCLFCFCPLYFVKECGGDYSITIKGAKDCSKCHKPHDENSYEFVMEQMNRLFDIINGQEKMIWVKEDK